MNEEPTADIDSRESLIRWLVWNDPNGCYTDEDAMLEWGRAHSLSTLRELYSHFQNDEV